MTKSYLIRLWRIFIVITITFVIYILFKSFFIYIYPFLFATIISFFINPFVQTLELKLKLPRPIATFIVICIIIMLFTGASFLIITEVFQGLLYLSDKIPAYFQSFISIVDTFIYTKIVPLYQKIVSLFYSLTPSHQETIIEHIQQLNNYIATKGASLIQNFFIQIPALLAFLPNSFTVVIFTILATFFITNDWVFLKDKVYHLIPGYQAFIKEFVEQVKSTVVGFFKAQLILIFITGCIIYSGLLILKIEHALTISLLIALIDFMPVIGTGLVFIPWIFYLFITGNYSMTVSLIILYMFIIIIRQILEPKILTASVGMNPLIGLIILFISLQTLGVVGLIVTPFLLIFFAVLQKSGVFHKIIHFIIA